MPPEVPVPDRGQRAETGPANATRDFMHVADAGRALAHLLAGEVRGTVNVASGQPVTIGALGRCSGAAGRPAGPAGCGRAAQRRAVGDHGRHYAAARDRVCAVDLAGQRVGGIVERGGRRDRPAPPPDYDHAARLFRADRRDEALAVVEAVLRQQPDHPAALNLRGVLYRQRGDFARARPFLDRAASLDPSNETAWVNLGNVHLDMEDADAAVVAYERAWAVAPARTDTLRLLGNALARAGRDAEAIARFDQAVAAMPGAMAVLRDRARAHFMAGRSTRRWRTLIRRLRRSRTTRSCC